MERDGDIENCGGGPAPAAAVFDVGRVVIDIRVEAIPEAWARASGADLPTVREVLRDDREHERLERGEIDLHEYHRHIVGRIGREIAYEDFHAGWNSFYRGLMPGIEMLLGQVGRCARLAALSNTSKAHADVWMSLYSDVLRHFERVFCSHEIGARKPEPASYRRVLAWLELPAERVVFIDDNPENVAAAERLGMRGMVADGAGDLVEKLRRAGLPIRR